MERALTLVDLGGGSCEISLSERKSLKETISLPLGAVRLTEEFLQGDPATPEEIARMRKFIERELRRAERKIPTDKARLVIATSGTAAALADAVRASKKSGRPTKGRKAADTGITPAADVEPAASARSRDWSAPIGDRDSRRARLRGDD